MTTPTSDPVPSTSPLDLLFNAEKIDEAVNSSASAYVDRFGVNRLTLAGATARISAVNTRGAWVTATLYNARDVVSNSGTWYIALDTHTSGATFAGDLAAHWRVYQGLLATDLADTTDAAKGDALVGVKRSDIASAVAETLHGIISRSRLMATSLMSDAQRADAIARTGSIGISTALNAAIAAVAAAGGGEVFLPRGVYLCDAQITIGNGVTLVGEGCSSDNTVRGATCLLRGFTGSSPTVVISGRRAGVASIDFDNNNQGTGECWQLKGERSFVDSCSWRKSGGDGARIGATEAGAATFNANLWRVTYPIALNNTGNALYVHHSCTPPAADTTQSATTVTGSPSVTLSATNAGIFKGQTVTGTGIAANTRVVSVSGTALVLDQNATASATNTLSFATWPQGLPDVNRGELVSPDFRLNGHGLVIENAIDCVVRGGAYQQNTGKGVWLKRNARGMLLDAPYTEANGVELQVDSGATKNTIRRNRFILTSASWVISDEDNEVEEFDATLEGQGTSTFRRGGIAIWAPASGAEASVKLHAESGRALYAEIAGKKDSGSGGKLVLRTRTTAGVKTDRLDIAQDGLARLLNTTGLLIDKTGADTTAPGLILYGQGSVPGYGRQDYVKGTASGTGASTAQGFYYNGGQVGSITYSSTATAFNTSSDRKLKKNFRPFDFDAATVLRKTLPGSYDWKSSGEAGHGYIAQTLYRHYPPAASKPIGRGKRSTGWQVDNSKMVPVLHVRLVELEAELSELRGLLKAAAKRIKKLEAK